MINKQLLLNYLNQELSYLLKNRPSTTAEYKKGATEGAIQQLINIKNYVLSTKYEPSQGS